MNITIVEAGVSVQWEVHQERLPMGLECKTSLALDEAGFDSYWNNGTCYVDAEDRSDVRRDIVDAANSILNSTHEFFTWRENGEWAMKTREVATD